MLKRGKSAKKSPLSQKLSGNGIGNGTDAGTATSAIVSKSVSRGGQLLDNLQQQISARWYDLTPRDRWALAILMGFLLLFVGGYGGYSLHSAATTTKSAYQDSLTEYFWLRSQAGNIDVTAKQPEQGGQSADSAVKNILAQSGITTAEVLASGESVQLSFATDSQATMGRALGTLQQQGWQFSRLNVQQDPLNKQLQVQASVSR